MLADLIVTNANVLTMDESKPTATHVAITQGRFSGVGGAELEKQRGPGTRLIDAGGRTLIPGLNDSHLHLIRGGLYFALELRWEGLERLQDALGRLREQATHTPRESWVRVVGGWSEFQFEEHRTPTLAEINKVAPDTPVFVLHLYHCAMLNAAALRAAGITKDTPNPPGSRIERDEDGNPTGLLVATPNAQLLYATLGKAPKLSPREQASSTIHFMRELNRFGVTSCSDAGGGSQNYPDDYQVVSKLHAESRLTVRVAYSLFTQRPGKELEDFQIWATQSKPGEGSDFYRHNGAGEMLAYSAADFENFLEPRPDLAPKMEQELEPVIRHLVTQRWPFRIHATYEESIARFLNVLENVNRSTPFDGLRWWLDHCETISKANLERVRKLGGGIAIQHRMAFQGEHFAQRYGTKEAGKSPPLAALSRGGLPVGLGTDATRVASYNPWVAISWASTGRTVGGMVLYDEKNRLDRHTALAWMTKGSAWFSGEETTKGQVKMGHLADFAVLTEPVLSVPDDRLARIESVLTVVGGKIVYGAGPFAAFDPNVPSLEPDWSPVRRFGAHAAKGTLLTTANASSINP